MRSIYRSAAGKRRTLELYDAQLSRLGLPFEDLYVQTARGRTHCVRTGNPKGLPLLVLHGGNSTTAYNLLLCRFLLEDFCVYAVDLIGHPGKSDEISLPAWGYAYGVWAAEVIAGLGFEAINCYGNSFGAGVLAKLLCTAPKKVKRCVLEVPAGIGNALPLSSARMMIPLLRYLKTRADSDIVEAALFMARDRSLIDGDTMDILRNSFEDVRTKVMMPTNISPLRSRRCSAPVLVLAGTEDCLFPAARVLKRARRLLMHSTQYVLEGRAHMHRLTAEEQDMILQFLLGN